MINFDELPKYKAQRTYLDYIIYLEFEEGIGTWSVWDTVAYDETVEIDPRFVFGDEERGYLVRNECLTSNDYLKQEAAIKAAKEFIDDYKVSLKEENSFAEAV